jgi:hypothetical protein
MTEKGTITGAPETADSLPLNAKKSALEKSLLKKEAPLAPALPPLGVGAPAIPLYYRKSLSR